MTVLIVTGVTIVDEKLLYDFVKGWFLGLRRSVSASDLAREDEEIDRQER
jgi:hypothetical protein